MVTIGMFAANTSLTVCDKFSTSLMTRIMLLSHVNRIHLISRWLCYTAFAVLWENGVLHESPTIRHAMYI